PRSKQPTKRERRSNLISQLLKSGPHWRRPFFAAVAATIPGLFKQISAHQLELDWMHPSPQSAGVLSFERAQELIQQHSGKVKAAASESVSIEHALNRVLAEAILADRDFPPFPRATRDGYAVKAADLSMIPASLRVMGQVKAGSNYQG